MIQSNWNKWILFIAFLVSSAIKFKFKFLYFLKEFENILILYRKN